MPTMHNALPGRKNAMQISGIHFINGNNMLPPYPKHMEFILFGMGCFWGAEKKFWPLRGVYTTAVGYSAGITPNPTYQEVCSGQTAHNEVVKVVYDPDLISIADLLKIFWESHNPTQGMRQGNDIGTQYRSGIYFTNPKQQSLAEESKINFQLLLTKSAFSEISTEILPAGDFYYAEEYHQQYLAKNVNGYCGLGGLGIEYSLIDEKNEKV